MAPSAWGPRLPSSLVAQQASVCALSSGMWKFFRPTDAFGPCHPQPQAFTHPVLTPWHTLPCPFALANSPLGLSGRGHFPQKAFLDFLQLAEVSLLCGSLAPHPFPITNLISFYCSCLFNCLASPPKRKLQEGRECVSFPFHSSQRPTPYTYQGGLTITVGWINIPLWTTDFFFVAALKKVQTPTEIP